MGRNVNPASVPVSFASLQQKRRDEALKQQRYARQRQFSLSRVANHDTCEVAEPIPALSEQVFIPASAQPKPTLLLPPHSSPAPHSSEPQPIQGLTAPDLTQHDAGMADAGSSHSSFHGSRGRGRHRSRGKQSHAPNQQGHEQGMELDMAVSTAGQGVLDGGGSSQGGSQAEHPRQFWKRQLQQPEWMTAVPGDLSSNWLVLPKPEGPRVVVDTSRGRTVVRSRGGTILLSGHTGLPAGGPGSSYSSKDYSILDAVWHEPNRTLYIIDLMVWRGYALYDCTAEFRAYWLQSKLSEDTQLMTRLMNPPSMTDTVSTAASEQQQQQSVAEAAQEPGDADMGDGQDDGEGIRQSMQWIRVVPLCPMIADASGLQAAYTGAGLRDADQDASFLPGQDMSIKQATCVLPCTQDGLYFLHKEGQYSAGGVTPLALCWKDAACSAWPLDTGPQGEALEYQVVTLEYRVDHTVATSDYPPVVLGTMPAAWVQAMGPKLLRPGRLLRFTLKHGGILWSPDGRAAGADLHYEGPANQRRGRADVFSKILFQNMLRTIPLTWELLHAAAAM